MYGPYSAKTKNGKKIIEYSGNKIDTATKNVKKTSSKKNILRRGIGDIVEKERYRHIHKIDNAIFYATIKYFSKINAEWCNLPLTTLMISSPGEVYAGETLDYTSDTLPIKISWFNNKREIFLSESSQIYLELNLLFKNTNKVFSICNSFRKEKTDLFHLPEFQHIEFEGHINFYKNMEIATNLLKHSRNMF